MGFIPGTAVEQGQLPKVSFGVVSHQVDAAVVTMQFEVAVRRVQPAVYDLGYDHLSLPNMQTSGLSVSTVASVAFDVESGIVVSIVILGCSVVHSFSTTGCTITGPEKIGLDDDQDATSRVALPVPLPS